MKKKGDLSWNVIITAIIIVILLFVIIYFFRDQMSNLVAGFKNLIGAGTSGAEDLTLKDLV